MIFQNKSRCFFFQHCKSRDNRDSQTETICDPFPGDDDGGSTRTNRTIGNNTDERKKKKKLDNFTWARTQGGRSRWRGSEFEILHQSTGRLKVVKRGWFLFSLSVCVCVFVWWCDFSQDFPLSLSISLWYRKRTFPFFVNISTILLLALNRGKERRRGLLWTWSTIGCLTARLFVCVCVGLVTEHWPVFSSTISILLSIFFLDFNLIALLLLVSNMLSVYFPIFIEQFFPFFFNNIFLKKNFHNHRRSIQVPVF